MGRRLTPQPRGHPPPWTYVIASVASGRRKVVSSGLQLAAETSSPALARRHIAGFIAEHALDDRGDAAALVVTELVTNAVMHGRAPIHLSLDTGDGLRISVSDGDSHVENVAMSTTPSH